MQDTSSGQYELIHLLTQSWDGHNQTLFLVGDPKQSIYLFRQARVERFLRTMHDQRLGDIRLTPLRLTANFRSQATLVERFNDTFAQLFPTPEAAARQSTHTDVPFVAADPRRDPSNITDGLNWQPTILDPQAPPTTPHEIQQARTIRSIIEHWLNTPLPPTRTQPWRIAILARVRSHLTAIVAELKQHAIPYRAVDIDSLAELPEVLDALSLTRALLHPADRVAWLAILHAPWSGLSLADLLTLTGEGPTADREATLAFLVETRSHLLSDTGRQLLARTWPILRDSLATLGRTPLHIHVERTWRSLGGDAPLTSDQRLNVLRFLETLAALETEGSRIDLNALHARLRKLYAEPSAGSPSVELLTLHKAKGLEWDIVLVPSLERKGGRSSSDLLSWLELDGSASDAPSVLLAPIAGRGQESSKLNDWLRSIREARENAERKRLFYVACTRAKEELHLFGTVKLDAQGNLTQPIHGSLLKSCWPAAEPHFLEAAQHHAAISQPTGLNVTLSQAITFEDLANEPPILLEEETLSLTASAEANTIAAPPPILHRLPLTFNPLQRFITTPRLNYLPSAALPRPIAAPSSAPCNSSPNSPPGNPGSSPASVAKASLPPRPSAKPPAPSALSPSPSTIPPAAGFSRLTPKPPASRPSPSPRPKPPPSSISAPTAPSSPPTPHSPSAALTSGSSTSKPPNSTTARSTSSAPPNSQNINLSSKPMPPFAAPSPTATFPSASASFTPSFPSSSTGPPLQCRLPDSPQT